MAGICGSIALEPLGFDESVLEGMVQRLAHRGREVRRARARDAWFAAIAERSPAAWPIPGREVPGDARAVLDGCIDNASELAAGLAREGIQAGANHAHLLAAGFRAYGTGFLDRMNGCFAGAIHDPETGTSWLVRDPVGMRPLYLHRNRARILFASELRALLADPAVRLELDPAQLRVLLSLGFNPAPHTLLKGIHKMPPGHYLEIGREGVRVLRYDQPAGGEESGLSFDDAVGEYRSLLQRVVRRSGAEKTGILLSGGADSAALVLLRTKEGKEAATFTAGFNGVPEGVDERTPAWQAARALGSVHRERVIEADEIPGLFGAVARVCEEPVAAGWTPPFVRLMESTAGQAGVVWSGQGAGVLHGEDPVWRWLQWGEWVAGLPSFLGRMAGNVGEQLGRLGSHRGGTRSLSSREERERVLGAFFLFDDAALDGLLRAGHMGDRETVRKLLDRWREPVADRDPLAQVLYMSARTCLPDGVFLPAERIAAGCGVTIRFPYGDPEVVRWLDRLPATYRLDGSRGKRLHRDALAQWLPAGVLSRSKMDLAEAVRRWLQGAGKERVADWLLGPAAWIPSVLDGVRVRGLIDEAGHGRTPPERILLLIHLELWARETFLEGSR